jgi:hypothetical protein
MARPLVPAPHHAAEVPSAAHARVLVVEDNLVNQEDYVSKPVPADVLEALMQKWAPNTTVQPSATQGSPTSRPGLAAVPSCP